MKAGDRSDQAIAYAIDLGSNAVRMSIARRGQAGRGIKELESLRAPIRLGHDSFTTGRVSPENLKALKAAFRRFAARIRARRCGLGRAVATSALREAKNGAAVAAELSRLLPAPLELIGGLEEAALVRLAVQARVALPTASPVLLFELGGGSAEATLLAGGRELYSDCLKVGAVRLLEVLGGSEGRRSEELTAQYLKGMLARLKRALPRRVGLLVATGGNIEALAALAQRLKLERKPSPGRPAGLRAASLDALITELEALSLEGRIRRLGLRPDRADVILPAALVHRELLRVLGLKHLLIPGANLREGVLLRLFEQHLPGQPPAELAQAMRAAAERQAKRFRVELAHARQVQRLALSLFDQLRPLHGLDGRDRLLLELAALLHDCGRYVAEEAHHKHSHYLISQAMDLPGLSREELQLVALVARYHRRSHPKPEHPGWGQLKAQAQEKVRRLAALLRLADSLDRGHRGAVRKVEAREGGNSLEVTAWMRPPMDLERWSFMKKAALFEQTFDRRVILRATTRP